MDNFNLDLDPADDNVSFVLPYNNQAPRPAPRTSTPQVVTPRRSPVPQPRALGYPSASNTPRYQDSPQPFNPSMSCPSKQVFLSKWNIKYDGKTCVRDFFTSIEECIFAYDVTEQQVVRQFHEVLSDLALKYFRSLRRPGLTYHELKSLFFEYFDIVDFDPTVERQLRNLKQKANQPIREFLIEVRDLNRKLSSPLSDETLLPIIKFNLHPRYALCLSTNRITNLKTLIEIATNFETYDHSSQHESLPSTSSSVEQTALCVKCNKTGHSYRSCPNVPGKVCFKCRKPGFVTSECPVCSPARKN